MEELHSRNALRVASCASEGHGVASPFHELRIPLSFPREPRRAWMSMASRPALHGMLQHWITQTNREIVDTLATFRPRAVHFIGTGWDFFGFAMLQLSRRCSARFTVWPAVHPGQWGDDRIDLRLYRAADTVFCQSHSEANHLHRLGLDRSKLVVSGLPPMCTPDGDAREFRRRHGLADRPAVLFLGRREAEKGFDSLVLAWREVNRQRPDAILLLAGPGNSLDPSQHLPAESFLDLEVPGEDEKANAYAACDIFCLPSSHESFGIVFAEAWSYEKPVVCGPAPAPREWIKNGVTGVWTDGTPSDIAAQLLRLINDEDDRRTMDRAGGAFQRQHLTWKAVRATHLQAFGFADGV